MNAQIPSDMIIEKLLHSCKQERVIRVEGYDNGVFATSTFSQKCCGELYGSLRHRLIYTVEGVGV